MKHLRSVAWFTCLWAASQLAGCLWSPNGNSLVSSGGPTPGSPSDLTASTKLNEGDQLPPKQAAQACLATAKELQAHGDMREAILLFERARQLNPREREVSRYLAGLYDQQGNDTRALAEYRKALELAPHDADLLNDFGYHFYRNQDWKQAESYFRKAIAQAPEHERAWVNLGLALGERGRYRESFDAFSKVLGPAAAHSNLGVILASHQRPAEADAEFKQALRLNPDLPQARAFLAQLEKPGKEAGIETASHFE
jgi:Flp pilus assembly protein TadD